MLTFAIDLKILHYTPHLHEGHLLADSILALVQAAKGKAEVTVADTQAAAIKALAEQKPDILHVHLCWTCWAGKVIRTARKEGCTVVFSPHWALSAYTRRHEKPLRKRLRWLCYQRALTRHADALLAEDQREAEQLARWHDRVDTIPNTVLDSSVSPEQLTTQLMAFYRRMLDTRYHVLMPQAERAATYALLHVGMSHEPSARLLSHEDILHLRSLKPAEWRRIMLLADDEGTRATLDRAIAAMQLDVPTIDARTISRFPLRHPKERGFLPTDRLLCHNPIRRAKIKDTLAALELESGLEALIVSLLNARQLLSERKLSLRHLAELYEDTRYTDFDEDRFSEATRKLGIHTFARRMTALMHNTLQLDEGFWPVAELADRTARRMEQRLVPKE